MYQHNNGFFIISSCCSQLSFHDKNLSLQSMNNEWLYQVRIKLSQELADDLRSESSLDISKKINNIARKHQTRPVCTLDGFLDYVKEAERNNIKDYPLYHWTKSVVQDPDKQIKHSKSFAFYFGDEQIYEKELAVSLYNDLVEFNDKNKIEEIKLIDSNPRNNPQPPKNKN